MFNRKMSFVRVICLTLLFVLTLAFAFGCSPKTGDIDSNATSDVNPEITTEPTVEVPEVTPTPDPILPISIYTKDRSKGVHYDKIYEYTANWPTTPGDSRWTYDDWTYAGRVNRIWDIKSFFIFTSYDSALELPSGMHWGDWWQSLWTKNVSGMTNEKLHVGFSLTIKLKPDGVNYYGEGDTIYQRVLGPEDTFKLEEYFELYLYDDVAHQLDSWYSHVETKDVTENTVYSSIKMTAREGVKYIDYIVLEAYLYGGADDFDESMHFTGENKVSIMIYGA